jgi:oligoribonuclease NrnB/cAMP/cGMP phosphodiesterase (DHH superfamily)
MSDELIVFLHNDLDAAGCMLNIEYKWPDIKKKYFHTNYSNIPQITADIIAHKKEHGNTHIIIADVSFSDAKESLTILYNEFNVCVHIDHHMYPEGFWDDFPNMKVVYDKTKCATLLCNEYFGNKGKCETLDNLSTIIDVYDIWQIDHPAFKFSQDVNEYCWSKGVQEFTDLCIDAGYKLPSDFSEVTQNINAKIATSLQAYDDRKLVHRAGDISIIFVDDWFNHIMMKEMAQGANIVVGMHDWGLVKMRINQACPYTEDQLNSLRYKLTGKAEYGHMHVFTYRFKDRPTVDDVMGEVTKIVGAIKESCR